VLSLSFYHTASVTDWTNYKDDFPKKDMRMLDPGKPGLADTPVPALRDMYNPPPEKMASHVVPEDWKGHKFDGAWAFQV